MLLPSRLSYILMGVQGMIDNPVCCMLDSLYYYLNYKTQVPGISLCLVKRFCSVSRSPE